MGVDLGTSVKVMAGQKTVDWTVAIFRPFGGSGADDATCAELCSAQRIVQARHGDLFIAVVQLRCPVRPP